ncbi:MAG: hypothetical protein ABIW36_04125 [Terrimesophilobacter sp.]
MIQRYSRSARIFLPEATVVASLRAPLEQGSGYAWYSQDPGTQLEASVASVLAWLDTLSFTPAGVGLMGSPRVRRPLSRHGGLHRGLERV